jgi:hypothetical protein
MFWAIRGNMVMRRIFLVSVLMVLATVFLNPVAVRAGGNSEFERIISEQISAFNADDGARAFSYASPTLQRLFVSPDNFMDMVKRGYRPVYRQQSYRFAGVMNDPAGRPAQRVIFVDPSGRVWTAIYTFEQQPDGSWRISSCVLVEAPGEQA